MKKQELNSQVIKKNESSAKNKTGTTLKIAKRHFQYEEMPLELFLTTKKKTKIRNALASNFSTNTKLSEAQFH